VVVDMRLGSMVGMLAGLHSMCMGQVRMVSCLLVLTRLVMFSGLAMMASGGSVVLGGVFVMFSGFLRHGCLLRSLKMRSQMLGRLDDSSKAE
jgi:hypothetical protein